MHVIACGVLALDLKQALHPDGVELSFEFLPAGLHERPDELRRRLQQAVDAASDAGPHAIAVGYGLCGRGTVGIHARSTPLYLPRVQDCIALFLGSDAEYRRQFSRCPGTYYISAGWFREKVEPVSQAAGGAKHHASIPDDEQRRLEEKYGRDNAAAIARFYGSWTRNYSRAAFIDTGAGDPGKYHSYVRAMADEFGWRHERIAGNTSLLEKMLRGDTAGDEILAVPPGYVTFYDPVQGALSARPAAGTGREGGGTRHECKMFAFRGSAAAGEKRGRGLGIDAGGTCTDTVVYDFGTGAVIDDAKSLTTRWDFTKGISAALDSMAPDSLRDIGLIALSTTLATNAIVEGQGQRVGLLLMPPPGRYEPKEFGHSPAAIIKGRMSIDGREIEPVDRREILSLAGEMIDRRQVTAFAVSGYGAAANPEHELSVKNMIEKETSCGVCCGHELSKMLNFKTRALTAALNARIIPRLRSFLTAAENVLEQRGIRAPVMVVKGDGTLMGRETAYRYPVETILSGPAASVAGARHLTGLRNATVLDVGGTTTDIAVLKDGAVRVSDRGAKAGKWQTHVQAVDMRTVGAGGDSAIAIENGTLKVGPHRLAPLCQAAREDERLGEALDYIEKFSDDFRTSTRGTEILMLTRHQGTEPRSPFEHRLLRLLDSGPMSLQETAEKAGCHHWSLMPIQRLENSFAIQRCGLTPTDLLHAQGLMELWDSETARRAAGFFAHLCGGDTRELARQVFDILVRRLSREVLLKNLDNDRAGAENANDCELCSAILDRWLEGDADPISINVRLSSPVVGLGAPAQFFLPAAARLLGAELLIPDGAHVANAIGAITSRISLSQTARIRPDMLGGFVVQGIPGAPVFSDMQAAQSHAERYMREDLAEKARQNGALDGAVCIDASDRIASAGDGTELFLERRLRATIDAAPGQGRW